MRDGFTGVVDKKNLLLPGQEEIFLWGDIKNDAMAEERRTDRQLLPPAGLSVPPYPLNPTLYLT